MNSEYESEDHLFLVETSYAAAGVLVRDGIVVKTAPIYKWMLGKSWPIAWRKITRIRECQLN